MLFVDPSKTNNVETYISGCQNGSENGLDDTSMPVVLRIICVRLRSMSRRSYLRPSVVTLLLAPGQGNSHVHELPRKRKKATESI